jgi:hypothetical protein
MSFAARPRAGLAGWAVIVDLGEGEGKDKRRETMPEVKRTKGS